jgi:hypothetical protein
MVKFSNLSLWYRSSNLVHHFQFDIEGDETLVIWTGNSLQDLAIQFMMFKDSKRVAEFPVSSGYMLLLPFSFDA